MGISIKEAQDRLLRSGVLNTLGSEKEEIPFDSVVEEITALWADNSFIPAVKSSIIKKDVRASSDLLQSVAPDVVVRGNNIVRFRLLMAKHWQFAEEGRKRGRRPPVKAIERWITEKGIQIRQDKYEATLSVLQRRRKEAQKIAAIIGRRGTIERFGHKGSNFLKEVAPSQIATLSELVSKALGFTVAVSFKTTMQQARKKK